jgi:uncharacterized protein (DUF2267 family)
MSTNFNKYIQDGEQFIREVAIATGTPTDIAKGGRFLRAVLHAFRRLLPPTASLNLISQFPMLMKAIYVDGWKISKEEIHIRHLGDFIESVREEGGPATKSHFTTDYEVEQAIHAVFSVLKKHVSEGEINDVLATLPDELRRFLLNS